MSSKWMGLIGLVGFTAVLMSCKQTPQAPMNANYATMKITVGDKKFSTSYSAMIRGRQDIDTYPRVFGVIERLRVTEGEEVRKGQILFVIDQIPYKTTLNTAIANVKLAKADLATAELIHNNNKELYAQKVALEFSLETSENSYLTAQAALAQAEAQGTDTCNNLSYIEIKNPSDEVVGALPYRVGALVSANIPQPLTTVSDNSNMHMYFSMNENQLLSLTRQYGSMDDVLKNMPEVELRLNDNSIYEHKEKIESISDVIGRQTGTVTIRSISPNEARLLHSRASRAVIIPSTYENCIIIPQEVTIRLQDKIMIYKVVDGRAILSLITVAELNDGREYVVLDGLKAGEGIVSQGAGLVREGIQIK